MSKYSDPTANMALGNINREFSRLEKQAKRLRRRYEEGKISEERLWAAQDRFTGIYRHVLVNVMKEDWTDKEP